MMIRIHLYVSTDRGVIGRCLTDFGMLPCFVSFLPLIQDPSLASPSSVLRPLPTVSLSFIPSPLPVMSFRVLSVPVLCSAVVSFPISLLSFFFSFFTLSFFSPLKPKQGNETSERQRKETNETKRNPRLNK